MCRVTFILYRSRSIAADYFGRLRMLTAGIEGNLPFIVSAVPAGLNERWSPISFFSITFTQFSTMCYAGSSPVKIDNKIVHDIIYLHL